MMAIYEEVTGEAARESTGAGYIITSQDEGRAAMDKTVALIEEIVGEARDHGGLSKVA